MFNCNYYECCRNSAVSTIPLPTWPAGEPLPSLELGAVRGVRGIKEAAVQLPVNATTVKAGTAGKEVGAAWGVKTAPRRCCCNPLLGRLRCLTATASQQWMHAVLGAVPVCADGGRLALLACTRDRSVWQWPLASATRATCCSACRRGRCTTILSRWGPVGRARSGAGASAAAMRRTHVAAAHPAVHRRMLLHGPQGTGQRCSWHAARPPVCA